MGLEVAHLHLETCPFLVETQPPPEVLSVRAGWGMAGSQPICTMVGPRWSLPCFPLSVPLHLGVRPSAVLADALASCSESVCPGPKTSRHCPCGCLHRPDSWVLGQVWSAAFPAFCDSVPCTRCVVWGHTWSVVHRPPRSRDHGSVQARPGSHCCSCPAGPREIVLRPISSHSGDGFFLLSFEIRMMEAGRP